MTNYAQSMVFAVQSAIIELLDSIEQIAQDSEELGILREEAQNTILMFIAAIITATRHYQEEDGSFLSLLIDCKDKPGGEVRYLNEFSAKWAKSAKGVPKFFEAAITYDQRHKTDVAVSMIRQIQIVGNNAGVSDGRDCAPRRDVARNYLTFLNSILEKLKS